MKSCIPPTVLLLPCINFSKEKLIINKKKTSTTYPWQFWFVMSTTSESKETGLNEAYLWQFIIAVNKLLKVREIHHWRLQVNACSWASLNKLLKSKRNLSWTKSEWMKSCITPDSFIIAVHKSSKVRTYHKRKLENLHTPWQVLLLLSTNFSKVRTYREQKLVYPPRWTVLFREQTSKRNLSSIYFCQGMVFMSFLNKLSKK
jgi:hypothetical protein